MFLLHGDAKYLEVLERTPLQRLPGRCLVVRPDLLLTRLGRPVAVQRPLPARFATPGRMLLQAYQRAAPAAVAGEATVPMAGRNRHAADRLRLVGRRQGHRRPSRGKPPSLSASETTGGRGSEPVPSDLYRYLDAGEAPSLLVNGAPSTLAPGGGASPSSGAAGGRGDTVELDCRCRVRRGREP